ncbi:MAG TPA: adenylate/guanylate cyclase domain-containing protein [Candidatus Limnocylindrales bacterium]|nr:adenylate/guanylate cyclase domain-containing protein [Candidatus Limnocylindrales bacterium]
MSEGAAPGGEEPSEELSPDALRRDHARLAKRVGRLEAVLHNVEQIRDTNARLLDRLMGDLEAERAKSQRLLLNVLPQPIIDRLNAGEQLIADRYDDVAVVFGDLVGFTEIAASLPAATVVTSLNALFSAFDAACAELAVEKIKTIGDAYMAAAGLPGTSSDHVRAAADLTLAMRAAVDAAGAPWQIRIGLHSGPVVAGVIGTSKFVYDLWGDAVNVASRLETAAPPGRIQVSEEVATALGDDFELEPRGEIDLKGKGATKTFFLVGRR